MTENKEIKKVEVGDSPFVTDEDVFDIAIEYYKEDKKIMAEGSDKFDDKKAKSRIVFTMRYPSQADCESIIMVGCGNPHFGCSDLIRHSFMLVN